MAVQFIDLVLFVLFAEENILHLLIIITALIVVQKWMKGAVIK